MEYEHSSLTAQVFVKTFMLQTKEEDGLKACGLAGKEAVTELGKTISPAYISRLTRELSKHGYIFKKKKGKGYVIGKGERYDEFFEWLEEHPEWPESRVTEDEFELRTQAFELLGSGKGVISESKNRVPTPAWQALWQEFTKGNAKICIVPPDSRVVIVDPEKNQYQLKTWDRTEK